MEQSPEYAPIQHAGHESGEFFFVPASAGAAGLPAPRLVGRLF
jgi:hypothetical protein